MKISTTKKRKLTKYISSSFHPYRVKVFENVFLGVKEFTWVKVTVASLGSVTGVLGVASASAIVDTAYHN